MNPAADTHPSEPPVLELNRVDIPSSARPEVILLEQVDWKLQREDYWFIGGLHRSGKSDLVSVAAGLVPPRNGRRLIFGADSSTSKVEESLVLRKKIGVVFDGGQLLNHLTVAENVALPIGYHENRSLADAIPAVENLIELTRLQEWQDAYPSTISRNWRQRAGLARALALAPEVLFLDNPLSGLDPQEIRWWLGLLKQLAGGHPLFGGKKMTLAVTGDLLTAWTGQARQFAVIKDRRFHVLPGPPDLQRVADSLVEHLLPAELPEP